MVMGPVVTIVLWVSGNRCCGVSGNWCWVSGNWCCGSVVTIVLWGQW